MTAAIQLADVVKTDPLGESEVTALDHIDLTVNAGEFVALVGRSGGRVSRAGSSMSAASGSERNGGFAADESCRQR